MKPARRPSTESPRRAKRTIRCYGVDAPSTNALAAVPLLATVRIAAKTTLPALSMTFFPRFHVAMMMLLAPLAVVPAFAQSLDLLVSQDAAYQVSFEALESHGFPSVALSELALTNGGKPVPFWIEGSDDGLFNAGDRLTFIGRHLAGETSHYSDASPFNVFRLGLGKDGVRGREHAPVPAARGSAPMVLRHLEQDKLRVRFDARRVDKHAETWYWQRISVLDTEPFQFAVNLGRVLADPSAPVSLRLNLRGWSFSPRPDNVPDHRVELLWNGQVIADAEWEGQQEQTIEVASVPREHLRDGQNVLQLRVPARRTGENQNLIADVVLLNWVKLSYPFDGEAPTGATWLRPSTDQVVNIAATASPATLYLTGGTRSRLAPGDTAALVSADTLLWTGEPLAVDAIRADKPSNLAATEQQADYLMIAHGSLLRAIQPLAEHRRREGLTVAVIDVQDIYDEFNHGIVSAEAIREFISHSFHTWQPPAPRFVLLVGDASWDTRQEEKADQNYADWTAGMERANRFAKNSSTPYADPQIRRDLLPTLQALTQEGYAASDSELVSITGDDWLPDLAVGRLPVASPQEVSDIVQKIISYESESAKPALWRRNFLLLTNEEARMQKRSDKLGAEPELSAFAGTRIYPRGADQDNSAHQDRLIEAWDAGQLLIHFLGHGGRYIWRTGPPDLRKNHDLFTLQDVDRLAPQSKLPLVLSMTCYSAPFDHPLADSIGEKLLRTPDRGAVGVLAASWRNNPNQEFSRRLMIELTSPGARVGEAILRAKRWVKTRLLVQTYNYLGDPAMRLAMPQRGMQISAAASSENDRVEVSASMQDIAGLDSGQALIELIGADGAPRDEWNTAFRDGKIRFSAPALAAKGEQVRIYAWNDASGIDAVGGVMISAPDSAAAAESVPVTARGGHAGKPARH